MDANNDFLSQKGSTNFGNPKNKKQSKPTKEELKTYHEYYALNEYSRKCLVATNYFRVLNGEHEIPVPPHDTHYHKYFDKRCYERAASYQRLKSMGNPFSNKIIDEEKKPIEPKKDSVKNDVQTILKNNEDKAEIAKQENTEAIIKEEKPKPIEEEKVDNPVKKEFRTVEQNEKIKEQSKVVSPHSGGVNIDTVIQNKKGASNKSAKKKNNDKKGDDSQTSLF